LPITLFLAKIVNINPLFWPKKRLVRPTRKWDMEKRYNHLQLELEMQQLWEQEKTYATGNNAGPLLSIDTPPPTVSGALHIGHIFSYTQTDIIARYKRMSGHSVFYPLGFDDNGLATERYVEKKLDIKGHELPRSEFIKQCLTVTKEDEQEFKKIFQAMGLSVDWSLEYQTISDHARAIAQESFLELFHKGLIYRKNEPALYCTTCRTSVAQAELDDTEISSNFNTIVFTAVDGSPLLIGTTRPELLPSCVALLYNPADRRYKHLRGTTAQVPLFGTTVPVYEDEKVSLEKGTGLVMVCTFGDTTDIEWFKKFNLPYIQSIGFDGKMLATTGILAGLKVTQAREKILEELKNQELLREQKPITHSVNIHERCKKPVEIIALPQWFLRITDQKEKFLELADQINWYPEYMKARYKDWVEHLNWDWCLSRQRFYGIPFPVWHCTKCGQILTANVKDLPVDPQETKYKGSCACGSSTIAPDTDVMDTWNCSSLTPQILYKLFLAQTKQPEVSPFQDKHISEFIPMSIRPQAHDIIRTWAFYTIVKSWMHHQTLPWKNIVISGHVLSDAKTKLSKSQGNATLTPKGLLQNYSADSIRYWTASGALGKDILFSETQIKIGQKLTTKLWNAFQFIGMHLEYPTAHGHVHKSPHLGLVNDWILNEVSACFDQYKKVLEENEFNLALQQIETFFWSQFCDNYLELIKDMVFNPDKYDAHAVQTTRWTLYSVGLRILQMYAPYQPHVTEAIYQELYRKTMEVPSIHQTKFTAIQTTHVATTSAALMATILNIVGQVRRLKTEHELSLGTELACVEVYSDNATVMEALEANKQLLMGATRARDIVIFSQKSKNTSLEEKNGELIATVVG
jgi:valyl-tRNA synthetase